MRVLATPSATLAISFSRTGDCGLPDTTRLPKAAASCGWSLARSVSCCRWPFSTPTGVEELACGDRLQRGVEGQAHGGDAVGVEPHPHGVELLAEHLDLRHAR